MKILRYKNMFFDEWEENEHGTHAQICEHCVEKYKGRMDLEIDSSGGVGACSVRGCSTIGADDDVEMTYIDFDINGIEFVDIGDAKTIVENLLSDLECGVSTNNYGERVSDYHAIMTNENAYSISIQITEEKDGLSEDEYFYSVHVINDITGENCDLFSTQDLSAEGLTETISNLIKNNLYCLKKVV